MTGMANQMMLIQGLCRHNMRMSHRAAVAIVRIAHITEMRRSTMPTRCFVVLIMDAMSFMLSAGVSCLSSIVAEWFIL